MCHPCTYRTKGTPSQLQIGRNTTSRWGSFLNGWRLEKYICAVPIVSYQVPLLHKNNGRIAATSTPASSTEVRQ
jgi:hypothetical protein